MTTHVLVLGQPTATQLAAIESVSPDVIVTRASDIPLTNARGVYSRSLAEFAIAAMLHFAKDLRRMTRQQQQGAWRPFLVEELHGKTLTVVGYGHIGQTTARLAHAFGMRI